MSKLWKKVQIFKQEKWMNWALQIFMYKKTWNYKQNCIRIRTTNFFGETTEQIVSLLKGIKRTYTVSF